MKRTGVTLTAAVPAVVLAAVVIPALALTAHAFAAGGGIEARDRRGDRAGPQDRLEATAAHVTLGQTAAHGELGRAADVLICIDINDNSAFADLTWRYMNAFVAAGAEGVSVAIVPEAGGTINFPPDLSPENYPVVVVLTSENWVIHERGNTIDPEDEEVLGSYLDRGGRLLLVGQDYMQGAHPDMDGTEHPCSGFPRDYLGLDVCYQDVMLPAYPDTATITGSPGWLFEGETFHLDAARVFLSNGLYGDCAVPVATGAAAFAYEEAGRDGVVIVNEVRGFRTVWAGIELSAAPLQDFHHIIDVLYDWLLDDTPVESASWGRIKSLFR
jgi:hypothetical protein